MFFFEGDKCFNDFFLDRIWFFDDIGFGNCWMFNKFVFDFKWVDMFVGCYNNIIDFVLELEIIVFIYIS